MLEVNSGKKAKIRFTLNGKPVEGAAESRMHLADFLRHVLHAYGTHVGCEHGVCGACSVLLDSKVVRSCMVYAVQAEGLEVQTVEGLVSSDGTLCRLQKAFSDHNALQCGFCTPGILMSSKQFLTEHPNPTESQVREMLTGHICRCTGYVSIVAAILDAAHQVDTAQAQTPVERR